MKILEAQERMHEDEEDTVHTSKCSFTIQGGRQLCKQIIAGWCCTVISVTASLKPTTSIN
jgi:hypothetical protein